MSGLSCECEHAVQWHHDERGCQYLGNGPGRCRCLRDSDTVVEDVARRHVRAALTEAAERLANAHGDLFRLAQGSVDAENAARLFGKCEGVRLAKSYVDEAVRDLTTDLPLLSP